MTLTTSTELARPQPAARHVNYFEVIARSHHELGEQLGLLFAPRTRECLAEARRQRSWKRKLADARPLLDATQARFPFLVDELRAYARAADIGFHELWTLSIEADLDQTPGEHCTTMVTNEGTLISHNEDFDADATDYICIVRKTLPDISILELFYFDSPLGGNAVSVNSNGFVQCINSLSHGDGGCGVPRNVIARWLSQTRNAYSDFMAMSDIPRAGGYNHVLVDRRGVVYNIECSGRKQVFSMPRGAFAHTNHYTAHDLLAFEEAEARDSTFARYARARKLLRSRMATEEFLAVGADTRGGPRKAIFNRDTVARALIDLEEKKASFWLRREPEAGWIDYPLGRTAAA